MLLALDPRLLISGMTERLKNLMHPHPGHPEFISGSNEAGDAEKSSA
jgi:hypothetical protein